MASAETAEPIPEGNLPHSYEDVRQWLDLVESMGELKRINGADWNLEIGLMAELIYRERSGTIPALLFDRIKGYPEGFRILFGTLMATVCSRLSTNEFDYDTVSQGRGESIVQRTSI
jgi:3-polyprenyl-4-hydroxybenzoate decarboxylase